MRLEITKAQAQDLRAQNAEVIEEIRYFAIVTIETVTPPQTVPRQRNRRKQPAPKRVYAHNIIRRTHLPPMFSAQGLNFNVWTALVQILPNTTAEIRREDLETEVLSLLPEYTRKQVKSRISKFIVNGNLEVLALRKIPQDNSARRLA